MTGSGRQRQGGEIKSVNEKVKDNLIVDSLEKHHNHGVVCCPNIFVVFYEE